LSRHLAKITSSCAADINTDVMRSNVIVLVHTIPCTSVTR
jgi:hypothetical protein